MNNKEAIENILKNNNALFVSEGLSSKLRAFFADDENKAIFQKFSYNENPFLAGIKSALDIMGEGFGYKMREISKISIEEALLGDAYKVQIDMKNVYEKLTTNVSRERKETIGTTSK